VSVLSSVLDVNDYSARSLIDQEPALLEISEKQLKVRKNKCGGESIQSLWTYSIWNKS